MKYQEWFKENIKPDWTILDIGCNEGIMSLLLADKAKFVYGMDFNKEYIQKAKKSRQKQNIEYICADATKYNFSQFRRIDCVILSNILEHIDKRVDFLKKLIDNIEWNDKNHRRFLFRVPMLNRDWIILYKKESGLDYRSDRNHFIEYTLEDFENELLQAQIKILNYDIKFGEIYTICEAI
jgi:SAM-dependent methyltransferase